MSDGRFAEVDTDAMVRLVQSLKAEVASLTAERDLLRDSNRKLSVELNEALAEDCEHCGDMRSQLSAVEADRDDAVRAHAAGVGTQQIWEAAATRAGAERDAALASLDQQIDLHAATLVHLAAAEDRAERMRAVVEAARAYVELLLTVNEDEMSEEPAIGITRVLVAAVDALDAGAATGREDE